MQYTKKEPIGSFFVMRSFVFGITENAYRSHARMRSTR